MSMSMSTLVGSNKDNQLLQRVFNDTPGKQGVIHFNNAGSSLMPKQVLDQQIEYLSSEGAIGGYETAAKYEKQLSTTYDSVAKLIGCERNEISLCESATVGWSMAFYSIPFKAGDRILAVESEYASNYLAYMQIAKEKGVEIEVLPSNEYGEVCLKTLHAKLKEGKDRHLQVLSITHIPTNSGIVQDLTAIGQLAKQYDNCIYVCDACQSVGQLSLDVSRIGCDVLSATSRKYLRGPRGVGFVYCRRSTMLRYQLHPPIIDVFSARWLVQKGELTGSGSEGGANTNTNTNQYQYELRDDARRFELFESNYAAQIGFGAAVNYVLDIGITNIEDRVIELATLLRNQLRDLSQGGSSSSSSSLSSSSSSSSSSSPQYEIVLHHADHDQHKCGIVSFYIKGMDSRDVVNRLRLKGINVSVSGPTSTLIDATKYNLPDLVRASIHYYNDESEIETFVTAIQEIITK